MATPSAVEEVVTHRISISIGGDSAPRSVSTDVITSEKVIESLGKFSCLSRSQQFHRCRELQEAEVRELYRKIPIVKLFARQWEIAGYELPRICSFNRAVPSSEKRQLSFGSGCKDFAHVNEFLIPCGMPFMVTTCRSFGIVYSTPFFSVIPKLIPSVPRSLFSMASLTYQKVEQNPVFRHELAYNYAMHIELPMSTVDALNLTDFWGKLVVECAELLRSPVVHPPVAILPNLLKEMKKLLLTTLPKWCNRITYHMSVERLLEADGPSYVRELLVFLVRVLDECVDQSKSGWISEARRCFEEPILPERLVAGLKIVIELVSTSKINRINSKVRDNLQLLLDTTDIVERRYYADLVDSGVVHRHDFRDWFTLWRPKCPNLQREAFVVQLASAFVTAFLCHGNRACIPTFFQLEQRRIVHMQCLYDDIVLDELNIQLDNSKPVSRESLCDLLKSDMIYESPLGKLIESRIVRQLLTLVEENLKVGEVKKRCCTDLGALAYKVATLVSLHFVGASQYYSI